MTLRLVRPPEEGQPLAPSKGRRSAALSLTPQEAQHFRAALRNVARAYGGFPVLAGVVGVPLATFYAALDKKHRSSVALAYRVARAAGMHLETLLTGQLSAAGQCKACGARAGHAADRRAS